MVDIVTVLVVHKATGGVVVDVDVCFFVVVLLFCVRFLMFSFFLSSSSGAPKVVIKTPGM